jgi:hypothetical protein
MSIAQKQLGLTDFFEGSEPTTNPISFTEEDRDAINEELFSGEGGERAQVIILRILLGKFDDEQQKEELIDEFRGMVKEATHAHFKSRGSHQ